MKHFHYNGLGAILECLFEQRIDLIIMETVYLNKSIQRILNILGETNALKILLAKDPSEALIAFKMDLDRCYTNNPSQDEITYLLEDILIQKFNPKLQRYALKRKIVLPEKKRGNFRIIQWKNLISFHKNKDQTLIFESNKKHFNHPISYQEIKEKYLKEVLFFELRDGCIININHIESITFIHNNYYHSKISDGRTIEITANERTRLLKFLAQKT